jgi:hypothetical protein
VTEDRRHRLRVAAQARLSLQHPHLLPVRAQRDRNGRIALRVREYPAPTLREAISSGPMGIRDALRILSGVAGALDALSRAGLVARDLDPDHIRVCPKRGGMLADLGIPPEILPRRARADDPNARYRSPEERAGWPIDSRSNVYSLGAVLLATQTTPDGERVRLPASAEVVVDRAMATRPEMRYSTPREFVGAMAAACGLRRQHATGRERPPTDKRAPASAHGVRRPPPQRPAIPAPDPAAVEAAFPPLQGSARRERRRARPRPRRPSPAAGVAAAARIPRPRLPRLRAPSLPRPRPPALPRFHMPRVRAPSLPRLRAPSLPRVKAPALPRFSMPSLPRFRAPSLPRVRAPSLPHVRAPALSLPKVSPVVVLFGLAVIGCLTAGILLGRTAGDGAEASEIQHSSFTIKLPENWGETRVVSSGGIKLSDPVAAAPFGEGGAGLVVGRVPDVLALDRRFRAEVKGEGQRTKVRLGRLDAWRYAGLEPKPGLVATSYLTPTTGGALLVICHAPRRHARVRLTECEDIASSIALRGERPASLTPVERHAQTVGAVMASLRREREREREQLAKAALADDQAAAARELERTYGDAARSLEEVKAPAGTVPVSGLVNSLRTTATAYGKLADAAGQADADGYRMAREAVIEGEAAVRRDATAPA